MQLSFGLTPFASWFDASEIPLGQASLLPFVTLFPLLTRGTIRINYDSNSILVGSLKDDILNGGPEDNIIIGLLGNDRLFGQGGNDLLLGGWGNDILDGGTGNNILSSQYGNDLFVFNNDGSFDLILDYQENSDRFILENGLTFSQLGITQLENDTQIRYLGNPQPIALLKNTDTSDLSVDDFLTTTPIPLFDSLIVFGDSLSDPGNLFDVTGFFPPSPPYFDGRFSNGLIWTDYIIDQLEFNDDQTFNFAFGGATTGNDNGLEPLLEDLTGLSLDLPGLRDEVDQYLQSLGTDAADEDGLYVIWAGANDLFNLPSNPENIPEFLNTSVENIGIAITTLAKQGADTFLVPNLPNLGLLPRNNTDEALSRQAELLSNSFNHNLASTLDSLEKSLPIDIIPVDIFELTEELINFPEDFRYTNVTDQLIEQNLTNDPGFFWWDQQHPTTTVHALLADVFQSTLYEAGYLVNGEVIDPLVNSESMVTTPLTSSNLSNFELIS